MKKRRVSGFTVIEMLVVIAIILILVAMMYPAISKVRESGRATTCVSNLRQLQLAAMNYANGGNLPRAVSVPVQDFTGAWSESKGWVAWQNGWTPSSTPGAYAQTGPNGIACIQNGELYTYARSQDIYMCPTLKINNPTCTRGYSMATNSAASGASIFSAHAATLVLFGDDKNCTSSPYDSQFDTNEVNRIHSSKGHVVFLDGHVEKW